jgi:hypothetical protein
MKNKNKYSNHKLLSYPKILGVFEKNVIVSEYLSVDTNYFPFTSLISK